LLASRLISVPEKPVAQENGFQATKRLLI